MPCRNEEKRERKGCLSLHSALLKFFLCHVDVLQSLLLINDNDNNYKKSNNNNNNNNFSAGQIYFSSFVIL